MAASDKVEGKRNWNNGFSVERQQNGIYFHSLGSLPLPPAGPVLMDVIRHMRAHTGYLGKHDKRMLAAAFTLAFFGLLRVSEFTVPSKHSFDPRKHASLTSIRWGHNYFVFTIKSSKTDQFRYGQAVYILKSDNDLCLFTAMHQYFKYCSTKRDVLLFRFQSGHPLTWHSCLKHLRSILTAAGYQPLAFNTQLQHRRSHLSGSSRHVNIADQTFGTMV